MCWAHIRGSPTQNARLTYHQTTNRAASSHWFWISVLQMTKFVMSSFCQIWNLLLGFYLVVVACFGGFCFPFYFFSFICIEWLKFLQDLWRVDYVIWFYSCVIFWFLLLFLDGAQLDKGILTLFQKIFKIWTKTGIAHGKADKEKFLKHQFSKMLSSFLTRDYGQLNFP